MNVIGLRLRMPKTGNVKMLFQYLNQLLEEHTVVTAWAEVYQYLIQPHFRPSFLAELLVVRAGQRWKSWVRIRQVQENIKSVVRESNSQR